jgi:MraZ protein
VKLWGIVSGFAFQGMSALTLDGKGRLTVPARHRDVLMAVTGGALTLTRHPDGYLMLFPRANWESFRDKLLSLAMNADGWRRIFIGSAVDVEIDSASRVMVAPELREAAGLDREVLMVGMGQRLEIWDPARHLAAEEKVVAGGMPEAIKDFVF